MIVKICGITSLDDAMMALDAGADWIGLNLVAGPRRIQPYASCAIVRRLPDPGQVVVLLNLSESNDQGDTLKALALVGVRRLQLYGHVTSEKIATLSEEGFEIVYVQSVGDAACLAAFSDFFSTCSVGKPDFVLLDASDPKRMGGTGRLADWGAIVQAHDDGLTERWPPIILAGGLTPENVAEAIRTVRPAGVDVSSGVESSPGRKDAAKVSAFIQAAKNA